MQVDGTFFALESDIVKLGGMGLGSNPGQPYIYECENSFSVNSWFAIFSGWSSNGLTATGPMRMVDDSRAWTD